MSKRADYNLLSFKRFCKRNGYRYSLGVQPYTIKAHPFNQHRFILQNGYWFITQIPFGQLHWSFIGQSFEECLAKCIYHGLFSIQTLDKYLPWSEVLRILFSSDKTANTDFIRQYLDDFGKHISKDLHTKLSKLIHEESLCATRAFYASLRESNPRLSHVIN